MSRRVALLVVALLLPAGVTGCVSDSRRPPAPPPGQSSAQAPSQSPTLSPTGPPAPSGTAHVAGWKLDWVENFNGRSLDPTKWNVRNDTSLAIEDSFLLASNVSVGNGSLRIQVKHESVGGRAYTSGYIDTNDKFALPDQFRVEVRAKVPLEMGMWSAPVWFRPSDRSAGEIDLVETYGADRPNFVVHQTVHDAYGPDHQQDSRAVPWPNNGDPTGWHTYLVEKTTGQIKMYVDGVLTDTFNSQAPSWFSDVFDQGKTWNMRVNVQVGGPRGLPDATTDWSPDKTAMLVDHIYTWTKD